MGEVTLQDLDDKLEQLLESVEESGVTQAAEQSLPLLRCIRPGRVRPRKRKTLPLVSCLYRPIKCVRIRRNVLLWFQLFYVVTFPTLYAFVLFIWMSEWDCEYNAEGQTNVTTAAGNYSTALPAGDVIQEALREELDVLRQLGQADVEQNCYKLLFTQLYPQYWIPLWIANVAMYACLTNDAAFEKGKKTKDISLLVKAMGLVMKITKTFLPLFFPGDDDDESDDDEDVDEEDGGDEDDVGGDDNDDDDGNDVTKTATCPGCFPKKANHSVVEMGKKKKEKRKYAVTLCYDGMMLKKVSAEGHKWDKTVPLDDHGNEANEAIKEYWEPPLYIVLMLFLIFGAVALMSIWIGADMNGNYINTTLGAGPFTLPINILSIFIVAVDGIVINRFVTQIKTQLKKLNEMKSLAYIGVGPKTAGVEIKKLPSADAVEMVKKEWRIISGGTKAFIKRFSFAFDMGITALVTIVGWCYASMLQPKHMINAGHVFKFAFTSVFGAFVFILLASTNSMYNSFLNMIQRAVGPDVADLEALYDAVSSKRLELSYGGVVITWSLVTKYVVSILSGYVIASWNYLVDFTQSGYF